MSTEHTSLKTTNTPVGDSNTTNEMIIGNSNTYQRPFLIVAGSLLALLVLIAGAGTIGGGGHHLQSSAYEITESALALADYQVESANLALTKDIFGLGAISENDHYCPWGHNCSGHCCYMYAICSDNNWTCGNCCKKINDCIPDKTCKDKCT